MQFPVEAFKDNGWYPQPGTSPRLPQERGRVVGVNILAFVLFLILAGTIAYQVGFLKGYFGE